MGAGKIGAMATNAMEASQNQKNNDKSGKIKT